VGLNTKAYNERGDCSFTYIDRHAKSALSTPTRLPTLRVLGHPQGKGGCNEVTGSKKTKRKKRAADMVLIDMYIDMNTVRALPLLHPLANFIGFCCVHIG
jgi:hypothetical protein